MALDDNEMNEPSRGQNLFDASHNGFEESLHLTSYGYGNMSNRSKCYKQDVASAAL